MPRTFGDGVIHSSHFDVLVEDHSFPLHLRKMVELGETSTKIGQIIADNLVDNGATLQMGIGGVPDAALAALTGHKDLGIHTEMLSDGILPLVECNAITNSKKFHHPGRIVTSFVYGSKKLYDFLNDNTMVCIY
jgi:acyl-CoA hydrolase